MREAEHQPLKRHESSLVVIDVKLSNVKTYEQLRRKANDKGMPIKAYVTETFYFSFDYTTLIIKRRIERFSFDYTTLIAHTFSPLLIT